jgi:outer membrane protein assembly factor BamB
LVDGRNVFITTSEALMKSGRFTIDGARLKEDWGSGALASYTGGCVLLNGAVYAVSQQGKLTCMDWETGRKRWDKPGFDEHGSLIATADGYLFVQTGKRGDLVVAKASADQYQEVARARVFDGDGKTFTAPALAGGRVWCRSYAGEVVCVGWRD